MDSDRRRVGAPNHSIVQCSNVAPELFRQSLLSHSHWKSIILSSPSYSFRGNTKEPYYFCAVSTVTWNCECGSESAAFVLPSTPQQMCLPSFSTSGSRPLCLAFWILLGFGQWEAPTASRRVEGKRDAGIYFPGPLSLLRTY